MKRRSVLTLGAHAPLALLLPSLAAHAQSWPDKPIKIIVGLAAGGGTDATARIMGNGLAQKLGQPVVVDNRPGAGTTLAAAATVLSPPDGYTFFMASSSFATSAATIQNLKFDPYKDLQAVVQITSVPFCLVAHPSVPAQNIKELIALAKSKPGALSYASSGVGAAGHLGGELFKNLAGVDILHVPYKGSAPALTDVIAGRVDLLISDLYSVQARAKAGELRLLAVTSAKRAGSAPDVPTVAESGLQGYEFSGWAGLLAPASVPRAVVQKLNQAVNEVMSNADIRRQMNAQGADLVASAPEDFQRLVTSELRLWRGVAEKGNIRADS